MTTVPAAAPTFLRFCACQNQSCATPSRLARVDWLARGQYRIRATAIAAIGRHRMIARLDYLGRMTLLQQHVTAHGLDAFLVSAEEGIYCVTGISYPSLECPLSIIVKPETPATLVTLTLEGEHLCQAPNVGERLDAMSGTLHGAVEL
jgi:hypothetical protein